MWQIFVGGAPRPDGVVNDNIKRLKGKVPYKTGHKEGLPEHIRAIFRCDG